MRSAWIVPAVLVSGLTLVLPLGAAQAAPARPARPATPGPATEVAARRATTLTLPTGEHVRLSGAKGKEKVLVQSAVASGPGRTVVTRRLAGHTYVIPAVAEPYLGRFLDKSLFDATTLSAAVPKNGRLSVRISYRGKAPAAPGLTITSKKAGVASGYLTPKSSAAFGRALTKQWKADQKAGFPARSSLFTGVTKISAKVKAPVAIKPAYAMYTLVIKSIGADGQPQPFGFLGLLNVDDGRKYGGFVASENGEARVSVPKGTYSAEGDDVVFSETTNAATVRFLAVNELKVTGPGQTLTLDYRTATAEPAVVVPKPADRGSWSFDWSRTDKAGYASLSSGYGLGGDTRLLLAPAPVAAVGTVSTAFNFGLAEPGATPSYTYTVAAIDNQIPARPEYRFAADQLATVNAAYYGEGKAQTAAFLRYPLFENSSSGGGTYDPVARGTRRTEYAGATGGTPVWVDALLVNNDSWDDPGFVDAPARALPAGTTTAVNWLKGPLGAAFPVQHPSGYCFACRSGNAISIGLVPFVDSSLTHIGSLFGAEDGLPVARFRFYKNGKLVTDKDDYLGDIVNVTAGKATYKMVLDVDRRLQDPAQSTRTQTQVTFSSAKNKGKKLPADWYCDGASCRVLPVVQARLSLPLGINGTLPAGKSTVTVSVGQIQGATRSAITKAGLELRPAGLGWTPVKLTSIGGGKYQGVVDNTELEGVNVDVRFSGADKAGSTYRQTVIRAYTVAGS